MLAGALAGLLASSAVHPIDTIKSQRLAGFWRAPGLLASLRHSARMEGPRSLYRGFGAVALFTTPANALYFATYERCSGALRDAGYQGALAPLASAVVATTGGLALWVPQDVIKERQQVLQADHAAGRRAGYRTLLAAARTVHAEAGWRGFYRGTWTSFCLYTPLCGLYWMLYEDWKARAVGWAGVPHQDDLGTPWHFVGGLWAGGASALVTTPIDAVKIRQQVTASTRPVGAAAVLAQLWREGALFRGAQSRVLAVAPNFALTIALWEHCRAAVRLLA